MCLHSKLPRKHFSLIFSRITTRPWCTDGGGEWRLIFTLFGLVTFFNFTSHCPNLETHPWMGYFENSGEKLRATAAPVDFFPLRLSSRSPPVPSFAIYTLVAFAFPCFPFNCLCFPCPFSFVVIFPGRLGLNLTVDLAAQLQTTMDAPGFEPETSGFLVQHHGKHGGNSLKTVFEKESKQRESPK